MRYRLGFAIFVASLVVPTFAAASQPAALPFGLTSHGAVIVPVTINGSRTVSFLLDTGSNGSVISDRLAAELGMRTVARSTIVSASGQKEVIVTEIGQLTLGTVATTRVLATIAPAGDLDLGDAAAIGCSVQGVIGQDVLASLRYTIDYRERRIFWHESSGDVSRRARRFDLEQRDDRFLVRLPQDRSELRLVPDTGADALVLFQQAERFAERVRPDVVVGVTGLAGTRAAWPAVVRRLRVGDATLTDVPAVIMRREEGATAVDGLLPLHLFARVTLDGPERQLFIEER